METTVEWHLERYQKHVSTKGKNEIIDHINNFYKYLFDEK